MKKLQSIIYETIRNEELTLVDLIKNQNNERSILLENLEKNRILTDQLEIVDLKKAGVTLLGDYDNFDDAFEDFVNVTLFEQLESNLDQTKNKIKELEVN